MEEDERAIRELVATWMAATKAGDVETVLSLVTDDVVFLVPGRVMKKPEFTAASRAQAAFGGPAIDGESEIQEIRVLGDWAFMWTRLHVVVTPPGGEPVERAGHSLTILRRENGRWKLARDANLLAPTAK